MPQPFLSVVIPAYNEAGRIGPSLEALRRYADSAGFTMEIIVVDDGSCDGTPALLNTLLKTWPALSVLQNPSNCGKGSSVRRGVLSACGSFILITDADLSTPISEADRLIRIIEASGADVVAGSRALDRSLTRIRQPRYREYAGRCFNLLVRLFTGLPIHDTQCGFKLFRNATTRRAFELQRVSGFGFDPELLFLIRRMGGKIVEVPVRWDNDPATRVRFLRDSSRMLAELILLRWRAWRGGYGSLSRHR